MESDAPSGNLQVSEVREPSVRRTSGEEAAKRQKGRSGEQDGGANRLVELVLLLKQKRELANLDERHVREKVERYYRQNAKELAKLRAAKNVEQFSRSKEFDAVRRAVRDDLRKSYGVFNLERRSLAMTPDELLATHQSTKERLPYYRELFSGIFAATGTPSRILDLGCGMNPVAYDRLGCTPTYLACDISTEDMAFLNGFFAKNKITATAFPGDLIRDPDAVIARARAFAPEVILLLKLVDTLEQQQRHVTKTLLPRLAQCAPFLVVSFATRSLGGKKAIRATRRTWFEKLLAQHGWTHSVVEVANEKAYVIRTRA